MTWLRQWLASRRLQRMVEARRQSFAVQDYRKRRDAMLKVTRADRRATWIQSGGIW